MVDRNQTISSLFSLWSIQNSALQSFRTIFIGVETVTLSLAAAVGLLSQYWYLLLPFAVPGSLLAWVWRKVVRNRGYDDSYLRSQIVGLENGEDLSGEVLGHFLRFQKQSLKEKRAELSARTGSAKLEFSRTRTVLDAWLPVGFFLSWVFLVVLYYFYRQSLPFAR